MRFPSHLKQAAKRAFSAFNAFMVIASLLLSPVAHALEIRLGSAMNLRKLSAGGLALRGTLAAGSVVEIPDKYKVIDKRTGKINGAASFNNWLDQAGYTKDEVDKKVVNPKLDFYFPVKVVSMAKGSRGPRSLIGKTHFMALRVLAKSRGRMYVNANSPVYEGPEDDAPLWPQASAERRDDVAPAPQAAPAADPQLEASGPCENCKTPQVNTQVPESASDLAQAAADIRQDLPRSFNEELRANDFPALTPGFFRGNATCEAFIKRDGQSYGRAGLEVLEQISQDPAYMSNSNGAVNACPNFKTFSPAQKRNYWVWLFAALAWDESKCGADKRTGYLNPNGGSVGMFHIEANASLRRGRDATYGGRYCSGDPKDLGVNTRCAVRMLSTTLRQGNGPYTRINQNFGPMKYNKNGEWLTFSRRVNGKKQYKKVFVHPKAKTLMSTYAPCGEA